MQEIKKRRIVIASVLKPIDDTRMYDKLGRSLSLSYEVHIIGYGAKGSTLSGDIRLHALGEYSRISLGRFLAPWRILRRALRLCPDVLMITTHELLIPSMIIRALRRCKVWYDVQENFALNIVHGKTLPAILRWPVAAHIRLKEWITSPLIAHFSIAEQCYADELAFMHGRYEVLENKSREVLMKARQMLDTREITLVFSGTIAYTTGVFIAINIARALHAIEPGIRLVIIGYAAQQQVRDDVRKAIHGKSFISVVGLDHLVPHTQILEQISNSDFGIISYPSNASTWRATPTKLFEYMGYRLPILLIDNPRWITYCDPYAAAIRFNPNDIDATNLLAEMTSGSFYRRVPEDVFWKSEEERLLKAMLQLLSGNGWSQ